MDYIFLDTSALMHSPEAIELELSKNDSVAMICSIVLDELDKHKDFGDGERNYKARQAFKFIDKLKKENKIVYTINETVKLPSNYDMNIPDNKILACLLYNMQTFKLNNYKLLTYDNGMKAKAKLLDIKVLDLLEEDNDRDYKGYIEIFGTEEENDKQLYELMNSNSLHANEYIIIHDTDTENISAVRWDKVNEEFVDIKYKSNKIKPLNIYQSCAMDLLCNDKIPIKVIAGTYGAGKSKLTMNIMEERIYSGLYDKMLLLRNPIAVDDTEIGYLPRRLLL